MIIGVVLSPYYIAIRVHSNAVGGETVFLGIGFLLIGIIDALKQRKVKEE